MQKYIMKYEDIVFKMVKEYLSKNKPADIKKIIAYVKSRISRSNINLNKEGIKVIINYLLKKREIVEGSALTREEILNHPKRKKILNYIKENKVVYVYELIKSLNFANYIVIWHLKALVDFGFVKITHIGNKNIYYHPELSLDQVKKYYYIKNKSCSKILKLIYKKYEEGCSKTRISKELKMHPNTVKKYVEKLEELGMLIKISYNKKIVYIIKKELRKKIEKRELKLTYELTTS
ncbi:MAG: winged helix-turn-helix transcriptional regulator [Promethearchaeota archaeon]